MKDDEIDDLFRRNADYLADEPIRDFDKAAFWQQLQAELPKKAERRRKPTAWWWAAASVLLAGVCGGIWRMQSAKSEVKNLVAQETALKPWSPWSVSPQTFRDAGLWGDTSTRHRPRTTRVAETRAQSPADESGIGSAPSSRRQGSGKSSEMPGERVYKQTIPPETPPPAMVAIERPAAERPIPIILPTPMEVVNTEASEKPVYRVVHINEIRERKQQEAKARSRVVVRIGLHSGSRITTQTDNKPFLNIPIQH